MVPLPLANVMHHPLRSGLTGLGVAIGICMLITLSGLSRGSLDEVADRWEAVDADILVFPANAGDSIVSLSGAGLTEKDVRAVRDLAVGNQPAVKYVVPVYIHRGKIGSGANNIFGAAPEDLPHLTGGRAMLAGRAFDPDNAFAKYLQQRIEQAGEGELSISDEELAAHGGLEMVVDSRLARDAKLKVGDNVRVLGKQFAVVGIVQEGGLARAFIPRATAQWLGELTRYTMFFVKATPDVPPASVLEALRPRRNLSGMAVDHYRNVLMDTFGVMYVYINTANVITLAVACLFILVSLYTMVIQRQREIAILKSMGARRRFILWQVLSESLIITGLGTAAGILLSFPAGWGIEAVRPVLTVRITWNWILIGIGASLVVGTLAAIYPAWKAMRVDVVEALTLE